MISALSSEAICEQTYVNCITHKPTLLECELVDPVSFFLRWDELLKCAFKMCPSFLKDTTEIQSLFAMLEANHFKQLARRSVSRYGGVMQGMVALMDEEDFRLLPETARSELFSFINYSASPFSYFYPDIDALALKNANTIDLLTIGYHQFNTLIFDRALLDSHAVQVANHCGLRVIISDEPIPIFHQSTKLCIQKSQGIAQTYENTDYHTINVKVLEQCEEDAAINA